MSDNYIFNAKPTKDPRDWKYPKISSRNFTPKEYKSRKLTTPDVSYQGSIGACVGHSGRVVLGEVKEYRSNDLSPMCIYKTAQKYDYKEGEDYEGTSISGACKGLMKYGACIEALWPYGSVSGKIPECDEDASTRKIKSYYRISIKRIKEVQKILDFKCLWLSVNTHKYLLNIPKHGYIDADKYLKSEKIGGHAMALIGYIYDENGDLYWEFQNSWGTGWGSGGYCFIPHKLLVKIIHGDAYVLITGSEHALELKKRKEEWDRKSWFQKLISIVKDLFN